MPCAAEPTPYVNNTLLRQDDYFGHRVVSSPLLRQRSDQATDISSFNSRSRTITTPRKPVGSPSHRCNEESSDTIVHNNSSITPVPIQPAPPHRPQQPQISSFSDMGRAVLEQNSCHTPPEKQDPFLGKEALSSEPADPHERKATVISFRSASTRQVAIRPPLAQSHSAQHIISLNKLALVSLKDPIAARIPSSYQTPKGPLSTWAPPTIIKTKPDRPTSSINTSTIITTGCAPLQRLLGQLDGASGIRNDTLSRRQCLQQMSSQIPLRTCSHQRSKPSEMQRTLSQIHPVNIGISSEHQLNLTKQRSVRLCQISSLGGDRMELKSIPISISTSPLSPEKQKEAAHNAALLAFQQLRHQIAMKKTEGQSGGQLTPPKIRKQKGEDMRELNTKKVHRIVRGESGDTGDLSKLKEAGRGLKVSQKRAVGAAVRLAMPRIGPSDKPAVWHPEPSAEEKVRGKETGAQMKEMGVLQKAPSYQKRGLSPAKGVPRPGRPTRSMGEVVVGMAQSAWFIVEPVFDPNSGIRKRFERQCLTWQDVGLLVAAAMFMMGTFLATVVFARVVGIGLQAMRAFGTVFRLLTRF
jgi:hypothetical protein